MKNQRIIKKNYQFQAIINQKQAKVNATYVLHYLDRPQSKGLSYGISVGKKLGPAATRNKIKRQVRMMVKQLLKTYGDAKIEVIIMVRSKFQSQDYQKNYQELENLLKKITNK